MQYEKKVVEYNEYLYCPKCNSCDFNTQLVATATRRRFIKAGIAIVSFLLPVLICAYINREYSWEEGAVIGALLGGIASIILSLITKFVFKFIPDKYNTIFICRNCGKQIKK